ncbi:MAG: polysaccharide biosynthesis tyrosine autokinase [Tannerella sp.]|jgi:capsular exopolysaccharide synthesis family protein|nr:polysaccharide biosynthesis tyrosine autokinase [Tannerella sp.]
MEIDRQKTQDDKGGLSVLDIISKYMRHWGWFAASVAACLVAGLLFLLSKDVQYSVSLHALLNEEKSSTSTADAQLEALGLYSTVNNLENEIVIIKSPDLMAQVVEALHLNTSYYVKSLLGRKSDLYGSPPYRVHFTPDEGVEFRKMEMIIRYNNSTYVVDGSCTTSSSIITFQEELRELPAMISIPDHVGTLSVHAAEGAVPPVCYIDINRTKTVATALAAALEIKPTSTLSSVLKIDLRVNNAEKGSAVLEELVRKYNESASDEKKKWALGTSAFINDRLKEISFELGLLEDDVVDYKQKNKIVDLSSETGFYMEQTGEYERQKIESETQLRIIGMIDRFVHEDSINKPVPSLGVSDHGLSQAIAEYNNNVATYELLLKSTSENNPSRLRLEKSISTTRSRIASLIRTERESIRITLANINRQGSSVYSRIQSVPQRERVLLEKERQQKVIENLFLYLMQKREESNVAMASSMDKAKVVISPTDGEKVYPSNRKTLAIFMFFGLALPALLIFLTDFFRTTVGDFFELKRLTDTKVIGEICYDSHSIVVQKETSSHTAEQFRMLRNNIDYHFGHENHKLLLTTSSVHGEGKTFVGINLAIAFTLLDKRVLLVDIDMRRPNLSKYLHSKSKQGLTDYLTGNIVRWENTIEYMNSFPALHILKAGTIPSNPNELLMNSRFSTFIDDVKTAYDYVIFDSSPIGLVSDAFIVAEYVDMTLYVVREKHTSRTMISFLNDDKYSQLNNLHLVYNGMVGSKYGGTYFNKY